MTEQAAVRTDAAERKSQNHQEMDGDGGKYGRGEDEKLGDGGKGGRDGGNDASSLPSPSSPSRGRICLREGPCLHAGPMAFAGSVGSEAAFSDDDDDYDEDLPPA